MSDLLKLIKNKSIKKISDYKAYPTWYADTSNYVLNFLLSGKIRGGFEGRFMWQLAGNEATGKTRIWVQTAQLFLRSNPNYVVFLFSSENDYKSVECLKDEFGDRFIYILEGNIHQLETKIVNLYNDIESAHANENDYRSMVIVDSLGFLYSNSSMEKAKSGDQVGMDLTSTIQKNNFIVKLVLKPALANSIFLITNHVYIPPEGKCKSSISGGSKSKYGSNGILVLSKKLADKDERTDKAIIKIELRKGRPPTKENSIVEIPMEYHNGGLTRYGGLFKLAYECGAIISPTKGWYAWKDKPDVKFRAKDANKSPEEFFTEDRLDLIEVEGYPIYCYTNTPKDLIKTDFEDLLDDDE